MSISRPLYGIIGGMGPAASAEFVNYIYKIVNGTCSTERDYPRIILTSDSLAPDRKLSLQNDQFSSLTDYLRDSIKKLEAFQPEKIIICCLVAHHCIALLDVSTKYKIINIVDLVCHRLHAENEKFLLLASPMMYHLNLISAENLVLPEKNDISKIDSLIQNLKVSGGDAVKDAYLGLLEELSLKYNIESFVLACSDLHLANKSMMSQQIKLPYKLIDSLDLAARYIVNDLGDV